jgi:hypothetical protein
VGQGLAPGGYPESFGPVRSSSGGALHGVGPLLLKLGGTDFLESRSFIFLNIVTLGLKKGRRFGLASMDSSDLGFGPLQASCLRT